MYRVGKQLVPSHSIVTDEAEKQFYWSRLLAAWGVRDDRRLASPTFFPGCHPRSISQRLAPQLRRGEYAICLKSDGVRYVLFLTLRRGGEGGEGVEGAGVALMVDRSRNMYEVEVCAPEEFFSRGTLLEGELVWRQPDEKQLVFQVFDCVCLKGRRMTDRPFSARLDAATRAVRLSDDIREAAQEDDAAVDARVLEADAVVMLHFDPPISMRPKVFVDRRHAVRLWSERADCEHRVDGIILQNLRAPYRVGTSNDGEIFKWKEHSSIDLMGGGGHPLRTAEGRELPTALHGRAVRVVDSRIVGGEGVVVEYDVEADDAEVRLMATRTRPDKRTANGMPVVLSTVEDVLHNIRPEDLARQSD